MADCPEAHELDAALARLFPPDRSLTEAELEELLDHEIEVEDDAVPEEEYDMEALPDDEIEEDATPPGFSALHQSYAWWLREEDPDGPTIVYRVQGDLVVFASRALALAIVRTLADAPGRWVDGLPWIDRAQEDLLPEEIVERYGCYESSMLDGAILWFAAADITAIVAALAALGIRSARDDELVGWASGRVRVPPTGARVPPPPQNLG